VALVHELPEPLCAAGRGVPAGPHERPPLLQAERIVLLRRRQELHLTRTRARSGVSRLRVQLRRQGGTKGTAQERQLDARFEQWCSQEQCAAVIRTALVLSRARVQC